MKEKFYKKRTSNYDSKTRPRGKGLIKGCFLADDDLPYTAPVLNDEKISVAKLDDGMYIVIATFKGEVYHNLCYGITQANDLFKECNRIMMSSKPWRIKSLAFFY